MITDIRLQNFRSYEDSSFELGDGVNIIVGPNTSGKTNLLEAVMMLCSGRSYRAKDADMIRENAQWARVDCHTVGGMRTLKLEAQPGGLVRKSFVIDDQSFSRLSPERSLPAVIFEPDQLQVWAGEPSQRRNYIDELLEKTEDGYRTLRNKFQRTLQQRNSLLKKTPSFSDQQLFAWNVRFSQAAADVFDARERLIAQINERLNDVYSDLANKKTDIKLVYQPSVAPGNYASNLLKKLESNAKIDYARGFTGHGPQREDIMVEINARPASLTASRGELRTVLLALKNIELGILEAKHGKKPLILFDDVFSELDGARRKALTNVLANYQTFITTTDADVVIQHFTKQANIIPLTKE